MKALKCTIISCLYVVVTLQSLPCTAVTQNRFEPRQVWSIKTGRLSTAKIVIGRLERWHNQEIVHVSVIDIVIPEGVPRAGNLAKIDHMPFTEAALSKSVSKLLSTNGAPADGFEIGYKKWRADPGADVFAVSVSDAVEGVLKSAFMVRPR